MLRNLPFLFLLLVFILSQDACYSQVAKQPGYVPGQVLVRFKDNITRMEAEALHTRLGSTILKHLKAINVDLVKIRVGLTVKEAINLYQADPNVAYAEPNYTRRMHPKKGNGSP